MSEDGSYMTPQARWQWTQFWSEKFITSDTRGSPTVAVFTAFICDSIDIIRAVGSVGDDIEFGEATSGTYFLDWRVQTADTQSLSWRGPQVFFAGQNLTATCVGGPFSWIVSGRLYLPG